MEYVHSGKLGKILCVTGTCYKPRQAIGKLDKPLQIPSTIDYDLWCGPAAKVDLYRPKLHYDWHWDYNTGNGDMGNQGIHQMDIARWFHGAKTLSPRVVSFGGRLGYDDAGNSANTQVVLHDYPDGPLIFETRGLPKSKAAQQDWERSMDNYRGSQIGVVVQCENGYVVSTASYGECRAYDNDGKEIERWRGGGNHHRKLPRGREVAQARGPECATRWKGICPARCATRARFRTSWASRARRRKSSRRSSKNERLRDAVERMFAHLRANEVNVDEPVVTAGVVAGNGSANRAVHEQPSGQRTCSAAPTASRSSFRKSRKSSHARRSARIATTKARRTQAANRKHVPCFSACLVACVRRVMSWF